MKINFNTIASEMLMNWEPDKNGKFYSNQTPVGEIITVTESSVSRFVNENGSHTNLLNIMAHSKCLFRIIMLQLHEDNKQMIVKRGFVTQIWKNVEYFKKVTLIVSFEEYHKLTEHQKFFVFGKM